jgi:glutathione synthase/RimK-type ligase-like ATP-grasp enzyme
LLPALSEDDRLVMAPLRDHGIDVESAVWDSPLVDWLHYDALIIRSCWDYHERPQEFEAWLARVEGLGVPVWNPPPLLRWNMDKRYLGDLEARGVTVVPTVWLERGSEISLETILADCGWDDAVIKPVVSASGARTTRVRGDAAADFAADFAQLVAERDVMVQPFLREVVEHGEWSFVFVGGRYSHAVLKRPRSGDFRVQHEHGGSAESLAPRPGLIAQAERVMAQVPAPWLYARVDACDIGGELVLMELEMLEPSLFLGSSVGAPRRFADAMRNEIFARRTPTRVTPTGATPGRSPMRSITPSRITPSRPTPPRSDSE